MNPKTELSRRIVCKSTFHPGAKNITLRKVQADKIDAENQRLLRAIVTSKPRNDLAVTSQIIDYEKNTL